MYNTFEEYYVSLKRVKSQRNTWASLDESIIFLKDFSGWNWIAENSDLHAKLHSKQLSLQMEGFPTLKDAAAYAQACIQTLWPGKIYPLHQRISRRYVDHNDFFFYKQKNGWQIYTECNEFDIQLPANITCVFWKTLKDLAKAVYEWEQTSQDFSTISECDCFRCLANSRL